MTTSIQEILSNSFPLQTESVKSILQKAREPLSASVRQEFDTWCKEYNLFVPEPVYGDYIKFRTYLAQAEKCRKCNGDIPTCSSKKIYIENGILRTMSVACPVQNARVLIKSAQVPSKFRKSRAADYDIRLLGDASIINISSAIKGSVGVYIYGAPGTGKTMLSSIIINERAFDNRRSHFYTVTDLLEDLRDFDNPQRRAEKLMKVQTTPCLVIDDIGAEYASKWVASQLFSIIDTRYKDNLQTIFNSNFTVDELCSRYPDFYGERISRRIKAMTNFIYTPAVK